MSKLDYRQQKIQEKRKQTPWREFVMEICSWMPLNLYKNRGIISRYPPTGRDGNIVQTKTFEHNSDMQTTITGYHFFEQLQQLFLCSTKAALPQRYENENCDFSDSVYGAKNAYLCFGVGVTAENIGYSIKCDRSVFNTYNSFFVSYGAQQIYQSRVITNSYNIFYSSNIHDSDNIWFSVNLLGCHECIQCSNLENQSYMIDNQHYEKEEYFIKKQVILLQKERFESFMDRTSSLYGFGSQHCVGSGVIKSNDCDACYAINNMHNSHNIILSICGESIESQHPGKNCYDCINMGGTVDHFYGVVDSGTQSEHMYSCFGIGMSMNMYYSILCEACSFCLGCVGLKNKSYCILNKQYSKEERYEKVDEIFMQMEKDGTLGEFFPTTMNPFYFNDTAAYLIDPTFTKEEVTAKGYLWRDEPIKVDIPADAIVVKTSELDRFEGRKDEAGKIIRYSEGNGAKCNEIEESLQKDPSTNSEGQGTGQGTRRIDPEILKVIIQDEHGNVYKIVKMEYDFLMKHGLPLPRKHWLERMKLNFRIN